MFGIGEYFKNIRSSFTKQLFVRSVVSKIIYKYLNTEISPDKMSIKGGIVTIRGISQAAKSVIFTKKTTLISEINSNQAIIKVLDIR